LPRHAGTPYLSQIATFPALATAPRTASRPPWQGTHSDHRIRGRAQFSGRAVGFSGAEFSGGTVDFGKAKFSGGEVRFARARFTGGEVRFSEAPFSGGTVSFADPGAWSHPPLLGWNGKPPAGVTLP
jgi:Pentapeptide repeats (9 copies)